MIKWAEIFDIIKMKRVEGTILKAYHNRLMTRGIYRNPSVCAHGSVGGLRARLGYEPSPEVDNNS